MEKNSEVIPNITRRSSSYDNGNYEGRNSKIPHYLIASTGSCHDICKYGRRHAFEETVTKPIRKTSAKPSPNDLKYIKVMVLGDQNKEKVVKHKQKRSLSINPSPYAKSFLSNAKPSPNLSTKKFDSSKKFRVSDDKMSRGDRMMFDKHLSDSSDGKGRRTSGDIQTGRNMRASRVSSTAPLFINGSLRKARKTGKMKLLTPGRIYNLENGTSNSQVLEKILHVVETGRKNNELESSSSPISLSLANPPLLFNDEGIKYIGGETHVISSQITIPMEIGNIKSAVENHEPLEMGTCKNTSESIPDYDTNPSPIIHDEEIKHSGNDADEFFIDKNTSIDNDKVHHVKENHCAALRMVNDKSFSATADGDVIPALPSSNSPPLLFHGEDIKNIVREADKLTSLDSVTMNMIERRPLKGNHNNNLRKTRLVSSGRPVKLKFKRGKVVELHQESNVPKRLIFRRIKAGSYKPDVSVSDDKKLVENVNTEPIRESHKILCKKTLRKNRVVVSDWNSRTPIRLLKSERGVRLQFENNKPWRIVYRRAVTIGVGDGKSELKRDCKSGGSEYDIVGVNVCSGKVNLKHQNMQGKKDGKCLLNIVIEETASKLEESRKSKVKALVGAFETVISLQERKSCLRTAS